MVLEWPQAILDLLKRCSGLCLFLSVLLDELHAAPSVTPTDILAPQCHMWHAQCHMCTYNYLQAQVIFVLSSQMPHELSDVGAKLKAGRLCLPKVLRRLKFVPQQHQASAAVDDSLPGRMTVL